jgi:alpha-glucosidase
LPLSADFLHENVRNLEADQTSILSLYRALIALRRNNPAMVSGSYEPVATANDLLFFRRREGSTCFNVVLNFGTEPMSLTHGDGIDFGTEILLSTHLDRWNETLSQSLDLRGNEGVITVRPHSSGQE